MQTLSCVKFDQILALVLLEPWSSCVVVCRLCLVYNLTKFWLQFYWSLGVAVLQYVDFVLCIIWPNFGSSSTGSLEQLCCSMQTLSCVKFDQILALVLLEPWSSCVVVCRLCLVYNLTKFCSCFTGALEQLCCSMQTLSCVKFDQIQALVLLEPWSSSVVVCSDFVLCKI